LQGKNNEIIFLPPCSSALLTPEYESPSPPTGV
jgi:hypothetical protein